MGFIFRFYFRRWKISHYRDRIDEPSNEVFNLLKWNFFDRTNDKTHKKPRSAKDLGVDSPQLQNIVATVDLDCGKLDLKKIAMHARNAEYNPKRFAAVIMRIREPRTTALIFSSGKMVCTGNSLLYYSWFHFGWSNIKVMIAVFVISITPFSNHPK